MNIIEELGAAKVVGITGHIRPDGDCTGSVLGLYNYLKDNAPDIDVNVYLEQPSDKLSYLHAQANCRYSGNYMLSCCFRKV